MIPNLNNNGYLTKGIHKSTLKEIKQRFGTSSLKRKELFKGFQNLVQLLHRHKTSIKTFLLNGSFVTAKESPGDYDCILVVKANCEFSLEEIRQLDTAKEVFDAHLLVFSEEDVDGYHGFVKFFGHDQVLRPKGLLEVIL